jgi:hypothetical protein
MSKSSQPWVARAARFRLAAAAALLIAGCGADTASPPGTPGGPMAPGLNGMQAGMQAGGAGTSSAMLPASMPVGGPNGGSMVGQPVTGAMPCAVETVVKSSCQTCHGATPIGGAPMSLLSLADFTRDYTAKTTMQLRGQSMKMYELSRIRLNREMGTTPMPQGTTLATDAFSTLDGWLRGGAKPGMGCAVGQAGSSSVGNPPVGGSNGNAGSAAAAGSGSDPVGGSECDAPGAFDPLVADTAAGETCWEFLTHDRSSPSDTTKFQVPNDESYSQLYYDIPWPEDHVSTRFGSDFDNLQVLHHWLMFASSAGLPAGTVSKNVTGTTIGENTELIAGWAVGGCTTTYPKDVGVKLPSARNRQIMIQWHHYNSTGRVAPDGSKVQICTVPASARPHLAGLTFLGGEAIVLPPGDSDYTTSCTNDSGAPITIIGFTPHMHTIGSNMKSVVGNEVVFDKPFVFDQQVNYMLDKPYVLAPGATITSTCSYRNDTGFIVTFGQPTSSEMCYQFALAYPYGALNNGVPSLIGATNTCW